jgi:hypothetical protein
MMMRPGGRRGKIDQENVRLLHDAQYAIVSIRMYDEEVKKKTKGKEKQ